MTDNARRARELMHRSRAEHFAVGAFNVDNQETLLAIVRAAQAAASPVLVELSHGEAEVIGLANMRSLVDNYRRERGVEMYINLDHSPGVEAARAGIDAGFEFIHIDYSQANRDTTQEEIIAATREVVDYAARTTGALVESEPHYFAGSSDVHDTAIDYEQVRKTFSTRKGRGHSWPRPGSTRSRRPSAISTAATRCQSSWTWSCSLGSGCDRRQHQPARRQRDTRPLLPGGGAVGVSKVNVNSDLRYAYRTTLERQLREHPGQYAIVKLIEPVIEAVQDVVAARIELFGSRGKARP